MNDIVPDDGERAGQARRIATICYALYAAAFLVGGLTAVAAVIVGYLKREDAAGTWVASHLEWQIRTFWYCVAGLVVGGATMFVLIGFPILAATVLWAVWRLVRGWLALSEGRPIDTARLF